MSNPPRHSRFEFSDWSIDGRTITLRYRLLGGPSRDVRFAERLHLPAALPAPDPEDPVVARLLDGVHRAFGVSYYKASAPGEVTAAPVSEADARFWNMLYTEGMGEFYYRNDIDPAGFRGFQSTDGGGPLPAAPSGDKVLLLVGGGKDSIVAREVVRSAGVTAHGFALGRAPWIERSAAAMGVPLLTVDRQLDPALFELNRRGAHNGHIPISALIAFISVLSAYLGRYAAVIAANERSANEGNIQWRGIEVNHQWSKSLRFEQAFQDWCGRQLSGGPTYFSLLRPLDELRIGEAFTTHPSYFDAFTSCNRNFVQNAHQGQARWCGRCPKCVFVQLILLPRLSDDEALRIFGADFLADPANQSLIQELSGTIGIKPFECVGTAAEVETALRRLKAQGRLPHAIASWWSAASDGAPAGAAAFGPHRIPPSWEEVLRAYLRDR